MSTSPRQKPGLSRQDVQTPEAFLLAVKRRLGIGFFALDVAASPENCVAMRHYVEGVDGLTQSWATAGWAWCNPPYRRIEPWVAKAAADAQRGVRVAVLVPASVGSNWWRDHVHGQACVLLLNGRVTFVGHDAGYPKDLALLLYGPAVAPGYQVWSWQDLLKEVA